MRLLLLVGIADIDITRDHLSVINKSLIPLAVCRALGGDVLTSVPPGPGHVPRPGPASVPAPWGRGPGCR